MRIGQVPNVELKPCPFCGARAIAENFVVEAAVRCIGCRAAIIRVHKAKVDTGVLEAVNAWNQRTP